jgi:hypothetical protein
MDVDVSRATGPLVPEDCLQPDGARTSAQPTATRRTIELPAQGRTVRFMVIDSTSVMDLEETWWEGSPRAGVS